MDRFTVLVSNACPLPQDNVDTDQILPARFLSRSRAKGYVDACLRDIRFDEHGVARPGVALNSAEARGAKVLVARRNFGAGSSREAAVYALMDGGFRCVLATSFGDIFAANAVNNGVLPGVMTQHDNAALLDALSDEPATVVTVDLISGYVRYANRSAAIEVDSSSRERLLKGWDEFDLTRQHTDAIRAFRMTDVSARAWAYPPRQGPAEVV